MEAAAYQAWPKHPTSWVDEAVVDLSEDLLLTWRL